MELSSNKVVIDNTISNKVVNFPIDNIDTSWMTEAQKKFFDILKKDENKDKRYNEFNASEAAKGESFHVEKGHIESYI